MIDRGREGELVEVAAGRMTCLVEEVFNKVVMARVLLESTISEEKGQQAARS